MRDDKQKLAMPIYDDVDEHDLDGMLKKELADKGLEYRFIDFKQAKANGGMSRNGWIVYKRESENPRLQGITSLMDSDGLVRQGSMVLAVKTKVSAERQRAKKDRQNSSLKEYNKHVTNEVNAEAQKLGGSSRAIAGYEKNS